MIWFAQGLLIIWPLVVLIIFQYLALQRAIVASFVAGWIMLPPLSIGVSGLPDWTKSTASTSGVLIGVLLRRPDLLLTFRPRWFDWPVLGFCVCSIPSSLTMGFGIYEGLSSTLEETMRWGLPYLIGRIYLSDKGGIRTLVTGIAGGGICYTPLCLLEIRFSPILQDLVYGIYQRNYTIFGLRYGGFRPVVFMATGMEVGWWMCCASLCAYLLISGRVARRWLGMPAVPLAWCLAVVTVACKSTGALVQATLGVAIITVCRLTKNNLLLWLLVLVPPFYCIVRPLGYLSGEWLSGLMSGLFPADRLQSAEYRLMMEDRLIASAWQHPVFGWTRMGNFLLFSANGQEQGQAVPDGYWILVLCCTGFVGLAFFNTMILLPTMLFLRRFPVREWRNPVVVSPLALAIILPLFMIDNLSNAMPNPIYAIAMGALGGWRPDRRMFEALAGSQRDDAEAEENQVRLAINRQAQLVRGRPYGHHVRQLASLRVYYARLLSASGRTDLAQAERTTAEKLWQSVEMPTSAGRGGNPERAANANDLAWLLASHPTPNSDCLIEARRLVDLALALEPASALYWNTLGIICYRQGDHHRAIQALSRSVTLEPHGGTAFDFYFLALANFALGYRPLAMNWLDRAESWRQSRTALDPALDPIRAEVDRAIASTG